MATGRWRLSVDPHLCVCSGSCTAIAPHRFEMTDEGSRPTAELLDPDDDVVEAAETCPTGAITVADAEDGSIVAP
jgi:ferredoxin